MPSTMEVLSLIWLLAFLIAPLQLQCSSTERLQWGQDEVYPDGMINIGARDQIQAEFRSDERFIFFSCHSCAYKTNKVYEFKIFPCIILHSQVLQ